MPASIAGRGDAEQQSTVSPPDPLQFRRFLRPITGVRWRRTSSVEGEPLAVRCCESDCLPPFADHEEGSCDEDRARLSLLGDVNSRGD